MKAVSAGLAAHLSGECNTLATCWKLTRRDSTVMGFTDHDKAITFESVTYEALTGFTPSNLPNEASLIQKDMQVEGMLNAASIDEEDILAGLYDFAEVEIFTLNYADLSQGRLLLKRGWLGEVGLQGQRFVAELSGLTQRLSHTLGQVYTLSCRALLGDTRCGVNLTGFTHTGTITSVMDRQNFMDSSRAEPAGVFAGGTITFTSGANQGLSMEIKEYTPGSLALALPLPYAVAVGDAYQAVEGCDKTLSTCKDRFNNAINFRGEPHVPGLDRALETAGTRSEWE